LVQDHFLKLMQEWKENCLSLASDLLQHVETDCSGRWNVVL